jgi:hypothetical protein
MAFWSNKDASPARKYRFKMGPAGTNWWYVNSVTLPSFEINTGEYQLLNQKFKYPGVPTWNPVTISVVDTVESVENIKKVLGSKNFDFLQEDGLEKRMTLGARGELTKTVQSDLDKKIEALKENFDKEKEKILENEKVFSLGSSKQLIAKKLLERQQKEAELKAASIKKAKGIAPSDDNDFIIEQMDGTGKTFRTWTLVNSFITSVNYGDLDYSSDELVSIEITVAYDYATTEK